MTIKRSGMVPNSVPAVARKPIGGFNASEFRPFLSPKSNPSTPEPDWAARHSVDSPESSHAVTCAPSHVGELVSLDISPVWIPADRMKVWKGNPRHVIDPVKLTELGDSIQAYGQSDPVDVVEDPEIAGNYLILGGQRRWLAITQRNLQEGKLLARVRHGVPSAELMFAAAIETQANTDPLQDLDYAITLACTEDEIGVRALSKIIKKSPGEISKFRTIGKLPSNLIAYLKEHASKFSCLFAYEVALMHERMGEEMAFEFSRAIVCRNLSHKAATSLKLKMMDDLQPKTRASWSTIKFQSGSMRLKESTGEIDVKLKGLSAEAMKNIQEVIKEATKESGS